MKKTIRQLLATATVMILMCSMSITAFALDSSNEAWIQENVTVSGSTITTSSVTVKSYLSLSDSTGADPSIQLADGSTVYYSASNEDDLNTATVNAMATATANEKMDGMSSVMGDITADTSSVASMISSFVPIINMLLGAIAVFIMFGMAITTSIDVVYIAFPMVRDMCDGFKLDGNSAMTKKDANGDVKLRLVSDDAQFAVKSTVTDQGASGRSPFAVYFQQRVVAYILLTIVMFMLLTGNITIITDIALNLVSGILEIIQGLA